MSYGRSELSLHANFQRLEGKAEVRVLCMDLASAYRALVPKNFLRARIVTDSAWERLLPGCGRRVVNWLGDRDSNPDKQSQSLLSYR